MHLTYNIASGNPQIGKERLVIIWTTFLITFGLGYPTVNRYDARNGSRRHILLQNGGWAGARAG